MNLAALLRALRRRADLSQRELAVRSGVPQATVARIEAGRARDPKFQTVRRLVLAAGGHFAVGTAVARPDATLAGAVSASIPHEGRRDEGGRHYPAHLDVRDVREPKDWPGAWWAYWYSLPPERFPLRLPAATYDLCRQRRDLRRWRTEVQRVVRIRRITDDLPAGGWQLAAELPDGELVGELRAYERDIHPYESSPSVGMAGRADSNRREVVLDGIVVVPECRGLGIGRSLVEALATEVDQAGLRTVRAIAENAGIRFLSRCGFRIETLRPARLTLTL